jgi:creatinine amidohydrolase/Fe(II)-dependent formamide hydrolase-like protein
MLTRYRPGQSRRLPEGSPGSVGYPTLASAQKGERLYTFILERVSKCLIRS